MCPSDFPYSQSVVPFKEPCYSRYSGRYSALPSQTRALYSSGPQGGTGNEKELTFPVRLPIRAQKPSGAKKLQAHTMSHEQLAGIALLSVIGFGMRRKGENWDTGGSL